ncbi:MAG: hypothetical protein AAFY84_16205 [Pseudomonadota bacterium]
MDKQEEEKIAALAGGVGDGNCTQRISDWLTHNTAKKAIKKALKAPRSAKFSNYHTQLVGDAQARCDYIVTVDVDAQNSFGAMVRQSMIVAVAINPNTKIGSGQVLSE